MAKLYSREWWAQVPPENFHTEQAKFWRQNAKEWRKIEKMWKWVAVGYFVSAACWGLYLVLAWAQN